MSTPSAIPARDESAGNLTLPPLCAASLRELYAAKQQADMLYTTAQNIALAALGLDYRLNHEVNLDTGIVTVAEPPKEKE